MPVNEQRDVRAHSKDHCSAEPGGIGPPARFPPLRTRLSAQCCAMCARGPVAVIRDNLPTFVAKSANCRRIGGAARSHANSSEFSDSLLR
jgi:hypothetical protein